MLYPIASFAHDALNWGYCRKTDRGRSGSRGTQLPPRRSRIRLRQRRPGNY